MPGKITLNLPPNYDRSLLPISAVRYRQWWEDNALTRGHARHCLPLAMANSLGYYILSPATFEATWDGRPDSRAVVSVGDASSHAVVDNHAAYGSFTVQAAFAAATERPGDYLKIQGIPNERGLPYSCMESVVEAWWSPATFGLVYLLNRPGSVLVRRGDPIAQMFAFRADHCELWAAEGMTEEHRGWAARRGRPDYRKDHDYTKGMYPDGRKAEGHRTNWKSET